MDAAFLVGRFDLVRDLARKIPAQRLTTKTRVKLAVAAAPVPKPLMRRALQRLQAPQGQR